MKEQINLTELAIFMKRRLFFILAIFLTSLGLTTIYTMYMAVPQYESTTQMLVNPSNDEAGTINLRDIDTNIQMINTFKELIQGPAVLDDVINTMRLEESVEELASKLTIDSPDNTQVFTVTVMSANPEEAAAIANNLALIFQQKIQGFMNGAVNVSITYPAVVDHVSVSPNIRLNSVKGAVAGLMVGFSIVLLHYLLDKYLRNEEFVTNVVGWHNLGAISEVKLKEQQKFEEKNREKSKND